MFTIDWRGDTVKTIKYDYDEKNRMIKATHFINVRIFDLLYEYKYDNRDNLVECALYDNVGFLWRDKLEFDERGNKIREFRESKEEGYSCNEKFVYDEYNNMTARIYFDGKDTNKIKEADTYKFIYDERGNILDEYSLTHNGDTILERRYEYNENGHNTKVTLYNIDGEKYREDFYKYDEKGNLIFECGKILVNREYLEDEGMEVKIKNPTIEDLDNSNCTKYEYKFYE